MCPAGIRMRVVMLWWPRIAAEFHGVSSQIGRISTTKKGVYCASEEARACRTALSMSSGSYSGLAIPLVTRFGDKPLFFRGFLKAM